MATSQTIDDDEASVRLLRGAGGRPAAAGRKKLLVFAAVGLLGLGSIGAVTYATGLLSKVTGGSEASTSATPGAIDLPEFVSNLNAGGHRTAFVRLKARLELANQADEAAVTAEMPRLQDLFLTYFRDMRPEELLGSSGTYRLREELLARANVAVAPARVTNILLIEMLVQ